MNAFIAYILGVTALLALLTVYAGNRYRRGRGERERRQADHVAERIARVAAVLRGLRDGRALTDAEIETLARELVTGSNTH